MPKKTVVAAGHICLDITPVFPRDRVGTPETLLKPGALLRMDGVDVHTGGSVANTGLAMAFLGADVHLCGKVGQDEFGRMVLEILRRRGGNVQGMKMDPAAVTSYSVVLALPGQDRIFLHAPGANDTFCRDDVDFSAVEQADLFHFGYPPLMRRMYEEGGRELVELFRQVKAMGVATSLDMAAVDPASQAAKTDWRELLGRLLPYVDIFLPSVEELCVMLGYPVSDREADLQKMAKELLTMGTKTVVIKCGAKGLYYETGSGDIPGVEGAVWHGRRGFQPAFAPEKLRSATGAGDTCIAAFLTAMLEGRSVEDCARLAAATGAVCVESYDALSGLQPFEVLEEKMANGWGREERYVSKPE